MTSTPPDGDTSDVDPIDDLIRSAGIRRRPAAAPNDTDDDPLGDLLGNATTTASSGSRLMDSAGPSDNALDVRRWTRAIGAAIAVLALSGLLADTVAASQLLADSGPAALAVVWPIGAVGMLIVAALLMKYVDRFPRQSVLAVLCAGYGTALAVALALFATPLPPTVAAGLVWLLADQLVFVLPLVIWSLAGDVFTAGQATKLFPRISLWMFGGQFVGLVIATTSPWWLEPLDLDLTWILVIPPIACAAVAVLLPSALRGASLSAGHGQSMSAVAAVRDTAALIKDLPAFSWLFVTSLVVMLAGALLEFSSFDVLAARVTSAGDLQSVYAGASLVILVVSWLVQRFVTSKVLNRRGVGTALMVLPAATVGGAVVLVVGGALTNVVLALVGLLLWRVVRKSLDASARQTAMATLPDQQRTRASFLIDLAPISLGYVVFAPIALVGLWLGWLWLVPVVALVLAVAAVAVSRRIVETWDTTQLSYRLKRRRRMG
jgi:AAA family ATP:ADP antiporter